jgi:hypothetical protein
VPRKPAQPYVTEAERGVKTVAGRMALDDYAVLRKRLHDDELSFQAFFTAFVQAYMRGDTPARRIVEDHKRLLEVSAEKKREYGLSPKEAAEIMDEIERGST